MGAKITTPEMDAFIHAHYKGTGYRAMAEMVNKAFGTSFTKVQIKSYYSRNKLDSGLNGRYKKGHQPFTKGKRQVDYMSPEGLERAKATRFKKGNTPHNGGVPVGTVRLRQATKGKPYSKPYYWEKVAQPNTWRLKHQIEWEKHNGQIPKGCMVTFADGNTLNCDIGNLLLETKAQHAIKIRYRIRGYDVESGKAANAIADLMMATSRREKVDS